MRGMRDMRGKIDGLQSGKVASAHGESHSPGSRSVGKTLTALALAATLTCGWAGGASAYPVSLSLNNIGFYTGITPPALQFDSAQVTLIGDTDFGTLTNTAVYSDQGVFGGYVYFYKGLADITGSALSNGVTTTFKSRGFAEFGERANQTNIFGQPSANYIDFVVSGGPISLLAYAEVAETGRPLTFIGNIGVDFFGVDVGNFDGQLIRDVGNNVVFSPVPLPASAPMFGAALLGLGVASASLRRKKLGSA